MSTNNQMSKVPLFKGLRKGSSTFYSFSSAMKDMIMLFGSDQNIRMNFSKFVCLNLPEWGNLTKQAIYEDPRNIASINDDTSSKDANLFFPKAYLQNYVENLCSTLDAYRTDDNFSNVAESAFWKAMLRNEKSALQLEDAEPYVDGTIDKLRYKEIPNSNEYNQLGVFVGDLNLMNHVRSSGNEHLETYGLVPTSAGKTTKLRFKKNNGIKPTSALVPDNSSTLWINGHEDDYTNASVDKETFTKALYDTPTRQYNVASDKDMLAIDWDFLDEYEDNSGSSFEFNAILLYYDIFDVTKPEERKRNLYGIVLLNEFENLSPTTEKIPVFEKHKPDENTAGNAYGFRFNLLFSNSTNNITSEIVLNNDATVNLEIYHEALKRLTVLTDQFNESSKNLMQLHENYNMMHQTILSIQSGTIRGLSGKDGENGKSSYELDVANGYTGTLEQWLSELQGVPGPKGDTGQRGEQGPIGGPGPRGLPGPAGMPGEKGDKGDKGNVGNQGIQGLPGPQGIKGDKGDTGTAGTKGDKGDTGQRGEQGIQGIQGVKGDTGKSTYEIWLAAGHTGTVEDFIEYMRSGGWDDSTLPTNDLLLTP